MSDNNEGTVTKKDMTVTYDKFIASYSPYGKLVIYNISDSTMFIDMGESYSIDKQGQASRLYSNAVTSSFSSGTSSGSVNLGAIAGAFGIGGRVGGLLSGVSVGGASTGGSSVQTFEERYISVPPRSNRPIKFVNITNPNEEGEKGLKKDYDINTSPRVVGHYMTYTFNPEGTDWKTIRNIMYIDEMKWTKNKNEFNALTAEGNGNQTTMQGITRASIGGWIGGLVGGLSALIGLMVGITK